MLSVAKELCSQSEGEAHCKQNNHRKHDFDTEENLHFFAEPYLFEPEYMGPPVTRQ